MLHTVLRLAVAFAGTLLTGLFVLMAIKQRSVYSALQAATAAVVTQQLLLYLRRTKAPAVRIETSGAKPNKHAEWMAAGLAMGVIAPALIIWLTT